tara:strand:+ start:817 stop:1416 length:600 start_codon:yes stop_codon:yes gene_type:complete
MKLKFNKKNKFRDGFTLVELLTGMLVSTVVVGGLMYIIGEANVYLRKQMYRDNVNNYAMSVMDEIFKTTINANFVNVEANSRIICGFRTSDSELDSLKIYQYRTNQGILVNGTPMEKTVFHNKDDNKDYYMQIKEFRGRKTFQGQGFNSDLRDAVIDIFLGIELHYTLGDRIITEQFPFKKTIFTRKAAVYNASKELDG